MVHVPDGVDSLSDNTGMLRDVSFVIVGLQFVISLLYFC